MENSPTPERMSLPAMEPLSLGLRGLVRELRRDSPNLSTRMLDTLRGSIPEYGALGQALAHDVYRVGLRNAELWYDALLIRDKPHDDDLQWIGRFSQRRHAQALSLSALLQAYRTGTRVYMDALLAHVRPHPALCDEVLFRVSPFLLYYSDLLSRTVSDAYLAEHTREMRWKAQMQARLAAAVFDPTWVGAFDDAAQALGIQADQPHVALALRPMPLEPTTPEAGERVLEAVAAAVREDLGPVALALHRGHWVAWLPAPPGEAADARERRLLASIEQAMRLRPSIEAAGLGLPSQGAAGWRGSAEQALAAIEMGQRLRRNDASFCYSEFALDTLMRQSTEVSALCNEMIAALAAEPPLLETLESYFDHRQNHKATAAALGIHRNTLLHRLAHIESLLGARLDDMAWLSRMYLALRQRRLGRGGTSALH